MVNYTSTPTYVFMAWFLFIKHMDNVFLPILFSKELNISYVKQILLLEPV
jgi:hypothetical protein